jgi:hypothetical protein
MSFQEVKKTFQKMAPAPGDSLLSSEEGVRALREFAEIVRSSKVKLTVFSIGNENNKGFDDDDKVAKRRNIRQIPPGTVLDLWDSDVKKSSAFRFALAMGDKIDASRFEDNDKDYIALWTNRVAMWRLFEHLVSPCLRDRFDSISPMLRHHMTSLSALPGGVGGLSVGALCNPFSEFGRGFKIVMNTWMPAMKKLVRVYTQKTRGGINLKEDFMSIATIAFLHALEKQALAIIANPKQAQSLPFPKRLEYAVRKAIYSEIPDLTGPLRIAMENPLRKTMPVEVGLDFNFDDHQS